MVGSARSHQRSGCGTWLGLQQYGGGRPVTDQQVTASANEGSVPPGLLEALARAVVAVLSPPPRSATDGSARVPRIS